MAPTFVLYHYPCPDGIFGALAASLVLGEAGTTFVPLAVYEKETARTERVLSLVSPDAVVYLIDFSGGPAFIRAIAGAVARVVLIDHHKTAQEDMAALADPPRNLEVHFDMTRSGASLARDFFGLEAWLTKRSDPRAVNLLRMIELVEDNDLWRHALPESRSFAAGFGALSLNMDAAKNPRIFAEVAGLDVGAVIAAGAAELERQRVSIEADLAAAAPYAIPGGDSSVLRALAVVTRAPQYRSELGNQLATLSAAAGLDAVGIVAYEESAGGTGALWKVSLRSLPEFDTTPFSRHYGGGGHKNASSFVTSRDVYESWAVPSGAAAS